MTRWCPLLSITVTCCLAWSSVSAALPTLIGRASCATATCHGGVIPFDARADGSSPPSWNVSLSIWQSRDRHAAAGSLLLLDPSRKMVHALYPQRDFALDNDGLPKTSDESYRQVLNDRCVSCHATVSAEELAAAEPIGKAVLARGVSCESCHGAASQWAEPHVYDTWEKKAPDKKQELGMLDTASWLGRIEICGRCHIGSRSADGLVRDMNHDIIAAGHPALRFDGWLFMENSIPHWSSDDAQPKSNAQRHASARWLALSLAAGLARERLAAHQSDPNSAPWPELSHYDCFACHHDLQVNNYRGTVGKLGQPAWNPWYVGGLMPQRFDNQLWATLKLEYAATESELGLRRDLLEQVVAQARQQADLVVKETVGDYATQLATSISGGGPLNDWHAASAWYIRVQAALADTDESDKAQVEIRQLISKELASFSRNVLNFQQDMLSPVTFLPEKIGDPSQSKNQNSLESGHYRRRMLEIIGQN